MLDSFGYGSFMSRQARIDVTGALHHVICLFSNQRLVVKENW